MNRLIEFYSNLYTNNKAWFRITLNWFLFAFCIGLIAFFINPSLLQTIINTFQERFGDNPPLDMHLALQIFLQNCIVSGVAILGGLIIGLGSILVVGVNGFLIGYIVASILSVSRNLFMALALILGGLVPHGILEIPAFLVAGTLGLRLGLEWIQKDSAGKRSAVFKRNLIQAILVLPVIVLVLFIAAIIEVFVSGWIVGNL